MRILLTGGSGQLGSELRKLWDNEDMFTPSSQELDITDSQRVLAFVAELHPDIVVHAAAYTDVDGCERDPDRAYLVNALGTQHLALACQEMEAALLFVSTDYVFDGQRTEPYLEFDPPNPINTYGRSKLAGEQAVTSLLDRFYIVRSSWLYSRSERNFVHKVLALAREVHELPMVIDEVSSPTYAPDLAEAIAHLVQHPRYGIYHFTNSGSCSRYDFAAKILKYAGLNQVSLKPIPLEAFPRLARPPHYSVLRNFCGESQLGITLRPWEEALRACLCGPQ